MRLIFFWHKVFIAPQGIKSSNSSYDIVAPLCPVTKPSYGDVQCVQEAAGGVSETKQRDKGGTKQVKMMARH